MRSSAIVALVAVAGCHGTSPKGACPPNCDAAMPPDLSVAYDLSAPVGMLRFKFVMDQFTMPDSQVEGKRFRYDVDGNGDAENKLGEAITLLKGLANTDPQAVANGAVLDGSVLQLLQIQTHDPALMNDGLVGVSGFVGTTHPGNMLANNFSGHATIDVDLTDEPTNHTVQGPLNNGKVSSLHLPPGAFPMHLPIVAGQPPVHMTLWATYIQSQVASAAAPDDGGTTVMRLTAGQLNGGLSQAEIHSRLIPAIAAYLNDLIKKKSPNAQTILSNFDQFRCPKFDGGPGVDNCDGMVEPDEVENNPLVMSIIAPDLDLFDDQGNFNPNTDHKLDSISFGVGFTAVGAIFPDQQ